MNRGARDLGPGRPKLDRDDRDLAPDRSDLGLSHPDLERESRALVPTVQTWIWVARTGIAAAQTLVPIPRTSVRTVRTWIATA